MGTAIPTRAILIKRITADKTQVRIDWSGDNYHAYLEAAKNGAKLPPVDVYLDAKGRIWLSDGHYRLAVERALGHDKIDCNVHTGTQEDALLAATGSRANQTQGACYSNEDKRNAVLLTLSTETGRAWSDNKIAKHCGVHTDVVEACRDQQPQTIGGQVPVSGKSPPKSQGKEAEMAEATTPPAVSQETPTAAEMASAARKQKKKSAKSKPPKKKAAKHKKGIDSPETREWLIGSVADLKKSAHKTYVARLTQIMNKLGVLDCTSAQPMASGLSARELIRELIAIIKAA